MRFAALLVFLLVAPSQGAPERPDGPRRNNQKPGGPAQAQQQPDARPLTITVVAPPPTADDRDAQRQQRAAEEQNNRRLFWLGVAQWVAAAAAVGVALFQARLLQRQTAIADAQRVIGDQQTALAREQNAIAVQQATTAGEQTVIAARQIGLSEQQAAHFRAVERASVQIKSVGSFSTLWGPENEAELTLSFHNSGRTPATITAIGFFVDLMLFDGEWPTSHPGYGGAMTHLTMPLGAGSDFAWTEPAYTPNVANWERLTKATAGSIVLFGRIDYLDAFDVPHWLEFGYSLMNVEFGPVFSVAPSAKYVISGKWELMPKFNRAG